MTVDLHFVVPGPLDQLTGGFVYDAHMVAGLSELGWAIRVHNLSGSFPGPDAVARESLGAALAGVPARARVVIDGLAMGGIPEAIEAQERRLRLISLVHHPLAEETGLSALDQQRFAASERRALAACAGVIVSSAYTARGLSAYGVSAGRVRVVVPGTEPVPPAVGPGPGQPPVLLCVASVTPRKGYDVLVSALARVADLEWTCVCAGSLTRDPVCAGAVLGAAARAGLVERLRFVGEREGAELESLYHGASVFVLASHYEGYGMALADALAHGLPVVSTTGGAIPFTVPAQAGLLVEPGDAEAFAAALRTVLDPEAHRRGELAAASLRHARELPTWRTAAAAFADAVRSLTP
ncbi:MAG: glycosyltransferase family 4 protein [Gemmatimonadetes bacterium]|nr:glycosyltransferase family 4 protein [Gemmatimonadota bacterium]